MASADDDVFGGAGFHVSFTFGEQLGVRWGLEGNVMGLAEGGCTARSGGYGVIQLGAINTSRMRRIAAAQGGSQFLQGGPGLVGELGVAAHILAGEPGVGLHTGVLLDTARGSNAAWWPEPSIGGLTMTDADRPRGLRA